MVTIEQSLRAALAATNRVTDPNDVKSLTAPFNDYRASCRFIEFRDTYAENPHPFESESAHVLTRGPKPETVELMDRGESDEPPKVSFHARRILRGPGRDSLHVPAHRFEANTRVPFHHGYFRKDDVLREIAEEIPDSIGVNFKRQLELFLLLMLMASAEHQRRVIKTDRRSLRETVTETANSIKGPATVLVSQFDASKVLEVPRRSLEIGDEATVALAPGLAKDIVLVIADQPQKVGFVRVKTPPETFVGVENRTDAIVSMIGELGFCIWGDAPIYKIDAR